MSSQYEKCVASVKRRAAELADARTSGRINENAYYRILEGHLDQPAFSPEWRRDLLDLGVAEYERLVALSPIGE